MSSIDKELQENVFRGETYSSKNMFWNIILPDTLLHEVLILVRSGVIAFTFFLLPIM